MKINESDIQELLKSAQLQINQGNFEKAKNLFKKVISINNNIPEVYNNLGSIYLNEKNYLQSILFNKDNLLALFKSSY